MVLSKYNDITRLAGTNGKFDICLQNPPYEHGLGNKFLEKVLNISDRVVTIQPLSWLVSKNQNKKITAIVDSCDSYIEVMNANNGFDAGFFRDVAIQFFDTTKKGKIHIYGNEYDKSEDVKLFSSDSFIEKFINKIGKIQESVVDNIKGSANGMRNFEPNPNMNWYCLRVPRIRGNVASNSGEKEAKDFFTIISNDNNFMSKNMGKYKDIYMQPNAKGKMDFLYFAFNTENELNNFINYIKTDFVRGILKAYKKGSDLLMPEKFIPWQDFTNPVFARSPKQIDDYLFKKYNIGDDIRQHIEEILPDYYGIR